jgi:cytochrome b5
MAQYYVGDIDASTVPVKRAYIPPVQGVQRPDAGSDIMVKILQFLVPVLILGLAFAVRHFTKSEDQ